MKRREDEPIHFIFLFLLETSGLYNPRLGGLFQETEDEAIGQTVSIGAA